MDWTHENSDQSINHLLSSFRIYFSHNLILTPLITSTPPPGAELKINPGRGQEPEGSPYGLKVEIVNIKYPLLTVAHISKDLVPVRVLCGPVEAIIIIYEMM